MNAWLALTKKEFRLGLPAFLVSLFLFSGIIGGGYLMGDMYGVRDQMLVAAFGFVVTLHIFYLVFYLIRSLSYERKQLHLWLHNPMPIAGLLSSKIITGIVYMAITLTLSLLLLTQLFQNTFSLLNQASIFNIGGTILLTIFSFAIYIAITFLFFWSIFLAFSQQMNDFLSFILTVITFFLLSWVYNFVMDLSIIETLTTWGGIQVNDLIVGFEFQAAYEYFDASSISETSILYVGHILREFIVAILMFIAACWMIDRKVEV
ncbi:hypothetical protein [Oceanobacillus sp. FSL H7-0719]|uniref:hypothetical protein n=1 Tax=Oceanobacillus sp. FSL H7-0719 TaxID=2954507 RepID=UPI00324FF3CB